MHLSSCYMPSGGKCPLTMVPISLVFSYNIIPFTFLILFILFELFQVAWHIYLKWAEMAVLGEKGLTGKLPQEDTRVGYYGDTWW